MIQDAVEVREVVKLMDVVCVGGDGLGLMQDTSHLVLTRIGYW